MTFRFVRFHCLLIIFCKILLNKIGCLHKISDAGGIVYIYSPNLHMKQTYFTILFVKSWQTVGIFLIPFCSIFSAHFILLVPNNVENCQVVANEHGSSVPFACNPHRWLQWTGPELLGGGWAGGRLWRMLWGEGWGGGGPLINKHTRKTSLCSPQKCTFPSCYAFVSQRNKYVHVQCVKFILQQASFSRSEDISKFLYFFSASCV
jgi:hypothetical protein